MRWLALAAITLVFVPATTASPWLQAHHDPGRTAATGDPGPAAPEIAFRVQLPGERVPDAQPLVIDGVAYILTRALDRETTRSLDGPAALEANALFSIDLATATVQELFTFASAPSGLASDGELLFTSSDGTWLALARSGGEPLWSRGVPFLPVAENGSVTCAPPAVADGVLYAVCTRTTAAEAKERGIGDNPDLPVSAATSPDATYTVVALDASTGELRWSWDPSAPQPTQAGGAVQVAANGVATAVALASDRVLVTTTLGRAETFGESAEHRILEIGREDGTFIGSLAGTSGSTRLPLFDAGRERDPHVHLAVPVVLVDETLVYVKRTELLAYDSPNNADLWSMDLAYRTGITYGQEAMALSNGVLYLGTVADLFIVDASTQDEDKLVGTVPWSSLMGWATGQLVAAREDLFALAAHPGGEDAALVALDGTTRKWSLDLPDGSRHWNFPRFAVSEQALVLSLWTGEVIIVGRTPASIAPAIDVSSLYPSPGEEVTLDLTGTSPGVLAPDLRVEVDWGDGEAEPKASMPLLTHTYREVGLHTATVTLTNSAGQSVIETFPFDVGGKPPPVPNLVERAFAREQQDLTFGVLGIGLALAGGAIAVASRRQRHGRLHRELAAVDAAAGAAEGNAMRLRAAMEERRAHCRGLLLDRKIEESQYAVLERHIDEVARAHRFDQIEVDMPFLPVGIARAVEGMLADGRVVAWERESLHALVAADNVLTAAQKRKIVALIDAWFAQDEGGAT